MLLLWAAIKTASKFLSLDQVFWLELGEPFVSQNLRKFYASYSLGQILVCAYIIWL